MKEFKDIPFSFISTSLTGYQKKNIEVKYEIVNRINKAKVRGEKETVFYELATELNIEYETVRKIYYTITKK